ncbi:DUF4254 domain-containing protein [Pedobacter changchengzhani]|uniref:DUF4254 domain-containing protein n=1 Tax=Pedobacter changchengzhani TaxID=2529274 RepID=A0A4R5MN82_9SPHI|nr:DUF4254 domain-containing protein [Pedobacter changchengzhani]TDG37006.1 DUF4254 domain-containing protein [Pedobacter changchengzhani]
MISEIANRVFNQVITDYHKFDNIDQAIQNPYNQDSLEHLFYVKNWIDTAQWHMEDVVRNPNIDPVEGLSWKRRIDAQNQIRTDMVEFIDGYFLNLYNKVSALQDAKINSESPAWALDRLSILALKIYHMREEAERSTASTAHREQCQIKLNVLLSQRDDLSTSIDELLADIEAGKKYMKVYKQMKMYNDPSLNPVLYRKS